MFGIEKDFQQLMEQAYGPLGKKEQEECARISQQLVDNAVKEVKMTKQTLPDIIEIDGVKYAKVVEKEPEQLKTLYDILRELDKPMFTDDVCRAVKRWMSQYTHNVMSGEYLRGYEDCMLVLEENLK